MSAAAEWHGPGCCPRHAIRPDLGSAPCDWDGTAPLTRPDDDSDGEPEYDRRPWHPQVARMARWGVG